MSFITTTTVTVLRGTAADRYGDEIDTDTVVATRVCASLLEKPVTGARPASGRKDTPRGYTLRVWNNVDVRQDDRIRDERTNYVYVVTTRAPSTNPVGLGSTRFDLQRVT
jgi:hypothetical protein